MFPKYRTDLLVLAGPLCSGKTTLAEVLANQRDAHIVKARAELRRLGAREDRLDLQSFGNAIEQRTNGVWLAEAVRAAERRHLPVIVDSARTRSQIEALRGVSARAVVLYLTASLPERRRRYEDRDDVADEGRSFESVVSGEVAEIAELAAQADVEVETDGTTPEHVASRVLRDFDLCLV